MAVLAAAATLSGCAGTTAGSGSIAADVPAGAPTTTDPGGGTGGPTSLPAPTAGPTTAPAPTRPPEPTATGRTLRFGTVLLPVPPRWTAKVDGALLCMTLSGDDHCTLQVVDIGRIRAEGGSVSTPDPSAESGWWFGSDVPNCDPSGTGFVPVVSSTRLTDLPPTKPVGTKTASYGSWVVSCRNSDYDFGPQLWWLPTSQIAFYERTTVAGSGDAVNALLEDVRFTG